MTTYDHGYWLDQGLIESFLLLIQVKGTGLHLVVQGRVGLEHWRERLVGDCSAAMRHQAPGVDLPQRCKYLTHQIHYIFKLLARSSLRKIQLHTLVDVPSKLWKLRRMALIRFWVQGRPRLQISRRRPSTIIIQWSFHLDENCEKPPLRIPPLPLLWWTTMQCLSPWFDELQWHKFNLTNLRDSWSPFAKTYDSSP